MHSNSYGSDTEGAYTFSDFRVDGTLRTFEDMLILFAAGNDGANINSVGSAGVAKNVLTVGALAHGNSPFETNFSNRGPTDDGRIKPDIMATGSRIESARGNETNSTEITPPSTASLSGTSMATPITAGAAAMMRQYYTDGFYPTGVANPADSHIPTGPLMKATLINGAGIDGGHFDKDIGWGRVFLSNSIMFDDSDKQLRVWEMVNANGLKTGENTEIKLGVKADQPLTITLAWYDVPAAFGASKTLVNDIDLEVKFNGQTYKGNVFSDIAVSDTGGQRDSINTVEQVRIPNPVEGIYTITVTGTNVPGDETINSFRQGFGLVATGSFDNINSNPEELTEISSLNSTILGDNGVLLEWGGGDNADYYEIYRVEGSCANADFKKLRFIGQSDNSNYTDFRTTSGVQYAYKIRAGQFRGLGNLSSSCVDITSTQACDFLPSFSQRLVQITDNVSDICRTELQWSQGSSNCPSSPNIKYNIYRSTDRDFLPSSESLLATVTSTSYNDIRAPSEAAYYIVRAEDNSLNGTGPNGGTETTGTLKLRSQAVGNGFTSGPLLEDVDNVSIMNLSFPWQVVSNKAADGILSYKTGAASGNYPHDECSSMVSNTISLPSDEPNPSISYKALYDLEENWDGVVVEISVDNGVTWVDLPPDGGYPGDFSETTANPVNACGYASTQGAFSGSNNDMFETFSHDLSAFTGSDVKIRWRLSTDPGVEMEGFYLDSIQYPNIQTPNACTVNTAPDRPQAGLYYDRGRNGHGFVIEPFGTINGDDLYFTVFYTYKADGTPEWYTSLSKLENNVLNLAMDDNTLLRVIHDFNVDATGAGNPNTIDTSIGTNILKIDFNNDNALGSDACNDGVTGRGEDLAVASWQLGSQQGDWCIEPLIAQDAYPIPDFGGIWWTGVDDDGWGFSLSFTGDSIVVAMYYFDASGQARWALGQQSGFQVGQEITINMDEFNGYARTATPTELASSNAGSMTLTLNSNTGDGNDGTMSVNVTYQGSEGGTWSRTSVPVTIFTEPH
ncbi:MAG: S8 family serine peptidase [Proteobacteria bacterium]|nr:S8 family serine peptidase [Pseudomonadota bacterium]